MTDLMAAVLILGSIAVVALLPILLIELSRTKTQRSTIRSSTLKHPKYPRPPHDPGPRVIIANVYNFTPEEIKRKLEEG